MQPDATTYHFIASESVQEGLQRIAREEITMAICELTAAGLDRHETIHQVRKRCKKLRGLLRLVRPELGVTYAFENARFRDAARTLSTVRDATALIETHEALMATQEAHHQDRRAFTPINKALTKRRYVIAEEELDLDTRLAAFVDEMQQARQRVESWHLGAEEYLALEEGVQKTYRRGRRAMMVAYANPTTEHFHEWRKRVKYHWYHCRLLEPVWQPLMQQRSDTLSDLSDLLGTDHDLAILRHTLLNEPDRFSQIRALPNFMALLDQRIQALRAEAHPLGRRLFAEEPEQFSQRIGRYWRIWRDEK